VREVRAGVWHWEARHPEWNERQWWGPLVSSYAIDDGARLVLFDPLAPPAEIEKLAKERETAIVLTCPWHERDARSLVERFGWPVYVPPPDSQEDLMQKFGVTAEQAAGGSPDVRWLLAGDTGEGHFYSAGDRLPVGVEAFPGMEPNDLVLWVESHRALVAGDTLQDRGNGLQFLGDLANNVPAERGVAAEQILEGMQPLLALPVEIVLLTHGTPTDRAALERALATSPN
jgi:glyoxylase-like metal-dependent hydrolase (beta-lactamase superfamily II)